MGSTTPHQSPTSTKNITKRTTPSPEEHQNQDKAQQQAQQQDSATCHLDELTAPELRRLVRLRDQEIRALKFELEKYKLALHQSQLDYHNTERQKTNWRSSFKQSTDDNKTTADVAADAADNDHHIDMSDLQPFGKLSASLGDDDDDIDDQLEQQAATFGRRRTKSDHQELQVQDIIKRLPSKPALAPRLSSASLGSSFPATHKVVFKAGAEELDNDEDDDDVDLDVDKLLSQSHEEDFGDDDEIMDDIIQDVGEIDLNLDLVAATDNTSVKKRNDEVVRGPMDERKRLSLQHQRQGSISSGRTGGTDNDDDDGNNLRTEGGRLSKNNNNNNEDDEDVISDGLLTSLTDAAISNLSQLAALQERCESQQQQHSHPYPQRSQQNQQNRQNHLEQQLSRPRQHSSPGLVIATAGGGQSVVVVDSKPGTTINTATTTTNPTLGPIGAINQLQTNAAAATAATDSAHDPYSATAIANQAAIAINAAASIQPSSSILIQSQQPVSSSSSISSTSTVQASDLNSSHSLASVVAAAAVAAAAANDHQQQQLHHQNQQHPQLNPQSRLISSAVPSPDFYHSLHQHHHAQQQNIHQSSPVSSLHFSPSTSVTPSSSSLLGHSRRSACSNASSSLMSPIASPNYLRRQFMPDRLPLLSPSPTSGLTTGSSSAASTSLAHILNHHQHQQRSASALGGPVTTASSTPLGSTGSTAVSPLMSNKNSSQARLNNMQIRHKFGYLGSGRAQFNSPHGFCLGLNQEIVVADTNNHRVCIFDKSGSYITQFGSPGKEEGQLWNPRKVAILHRPTNNNSSVSQAVAATQNQLQQQLSHLQHHHHPQQHLNQQASSPYSSHINTSNIQSSCQLLSTNSGSEPLYVVCDRGAERSRMQLFTKDGAFIKKIGIHYIDIVAGLAITQNGLIIVVDSVSPTVYIINGETGILNGWFDCSGHMKEPSDIAVKSDVPGNEYFICDFKGHCVVVFSEQGEYLRKIGHDGLTSYPNGIDISDDGDILVGDSHGNRFHVVVFDRNGNFVSQFECPHVKVSRCCGLKITREGYIVTLAKNNHHVLVLDTIHI